ncbi:MAG TPA: patatin-like phospholipase family protein, partial [bacterium]|nr:patatin-like phospholipase family protein [bacterium]
MPADTLNTTYRPRIGLVLSGGGARGMAHIGVLKILDELRIPVDVIAGTSAGAIVGGMYASGMDVAEIEKFARDIDWKDMLNDKPSRDFRSFRKKTQENENLMGFEVGFRSWNVVFPQGVIAGQKLSFTLKTITLPVSGIQDFDALPVPYRAVATDIATGERVVLRGGNLAEAMRASMSIPGVLAPVEINGRLLVDGMFVQNLPIDVAQAMGADVIIAVDIGAPLMDRSHLNSVLGITAQVMNMVTTENVNQQAALLTNKDVLIRPDIGSVSVADYLQADAIITDGEKAARQWIPMLRRFSVSDEIYNEFRKKIRTRRKTHDRIDFIRIGKNIGQDPRIYHRLKTQPGSSLNMKTLKADLTRIYALGDFEKVDFDIVTEDTSRGLLIDGRWKSWGPNYLRFGLTMATDLEGHSSVNALADYTMTRRNQLGAEWKHLFRVGQNPTYFTEWYQPLDFKGNFFMAPYGRAQRFESGFYQQRVEIA